MATLLPQELVDTVLDYLLEDDNNWSSSLKATSLICRSFLVSSQSRLFATISFRPPPDKKKKPEGSGFWSAFMKSPKLGFKTSIEAFGRSVAASPHLLGYVRSVNLFSSPRPPQPTPDHRDWLNSESHHLMTFLPNLTPKLRSFGMYVVDWNTLLPEVQETIKTILESNLLTDLTLRDTINFPMPTLASREQLQHLDLEVARHLANSARTYSVPNPQKLKLISLKLSVPDSIIDWLSTENCIFDISRLRHLVIFWGHYNIIEILRICSSSLESFEMPVEHLYLPPRGLNAVDMGLEALRKLHLRISLIPSPTITLSWVNNFFKRQSQMFALEEIILNCSIITLKSRLSLDLSLFSETDSILAHGENFPALRSVTILVTSFLMGCIDQEGYTFGVIETIRMRMSLLHDMGIVRIQRHNNFSSY